MPEEQGDHEQQLAEKDQDIARLKQAYAAQLKLTERIAAQRDQANTALARAQIALDEKDGLIAALGEQRKAGASDAAKPDAKRGTRGRAARAPRGPNGKTEAGRTPR